MTTSGALNAVWSELQRLRHHLELAGHTEAAASVLEAQKYINLAFWHLPPGSAHPGAPK